jgi:hypothetical protein
MGGDGNPTREGSFQIGSPRVSRVRVCLALTLPEPAKGEAAKEIDLGPEARRVWSHGRDANCDARS